MPRVNEPQLDDLIELRRKIERRESKREIDAFTIATKLGISEEYY